jgi:hypothetical protein
MTDDEIRQVYGRMFGQPGDGYLDELAGLGPSSPELTGPGGLASFGSLVPDFGVYADYMAAHYFGGSRLLFLAYLDIVATKGAEWPHYATAQHNIFIYKPRAMDPFNAYLKSLGRSTFSEDDVLAALAASTGKDHAGFFEFWAKVGFELDPNTAGALLGASSGSGGGSTGAGGTTGTGGAAGTGGTTGPGGAPPPGVPQDLPRIGTLELEHHLAGVSQQAAAVMNRRVDTPIFIELRATGREAAPVDEVSKALAGAGVELVKTQSGPYGEPLEAVAFFRLTTMNPNDPRYPFILTLPPSATAAAMLVYESSLAGGSQGSSSLTGTTFQGVTLAGYVPCPQPVVPIGFEATLDGQTLLLPALAADALPAGGAAFRVEAGGRSFEAAPGESVDLAGTGAGAVDVFLVGEDGTLLGLQRIGRGLGPAAWAGIAVGGVALAGGLWFVLSRVRRRGPAA